MSVLAGFAMALASVAFCVFAGVAIHELDYASEHPFRYGPAKVIAAASVAGALVALAVAVLALAFIRR